MPEATLSTQTSPTAAPEGGRRLGLHQPYFFPYLGYFQLLFAVDCFIAYDDVAWINRGWIPRNRYLCRGRPLWFTIPTRRSSSGTSIDRVEIAEGRWREKMLRRFQSAYVRAPYRLQVIDLLARTLAVPSAHVADLAVESLVVVRDYLGFTVPIHRSRGRYPGLLARGQDRVIGICRSERASIYINAIGGMSLYERLDFRRAGIELQFVRPTFPAYDQGIGRFEPGLSMLDVLMHNSVERVREMVGAWERE
jgi:hypothetical protein